MSYYRHPAWANLTIGLVVAALGIVTSAPARAGTSHATYIGHPGKVARVETRRLERKYSRPGPWQGATVQVACSTVSRLVDDCQATIQPPDSETGFWVDGTAYISADGHSFRVVWS